MATITWQLVSQLYQTAQKFFGKYDNSKNSSKFLATLCLATNSSYSAVVINVNNQRLIYVDSQNSHIRLEHSDLIDILPLLFQSYACTRLPCDRTQQLCEKIGLQAPVPIVDAIFFAFETDENESVFMQEREAYVCCCLCNLLLLRSLQHESS